MNSALSQPTQRNTMKISLVLFLISVAGTAAGAQQSSDFKPWPNGSREHRPVIQPTQGSTKPAPMQPENASPLFAAQRATIQTVGVNVLAAKHSVKPDPAVEALREQLEAVSKELVRAVRDVSTAKPVGQLGTQNLAAATTPMSSVSEVGAAFTPTMPVTHFVPGLIPNTFVVDPKTPSQTDPTPVLAKAMPAASLPQKADAWHSDMASLKNRITTARAQVSKMAEGSGAKVTRHNHLAKQQTQIFDDIQHAIDARDLAQLAALRNRLTPRSLPEERKRLQALVEDPKHNIPSAAPTPTVSTLTKHR